MTREELRDEFAKAAVTGILAGKWGQMPHTKAEDAFAEFAYIIADAMLRVKENYKEEGIENK